METYRAPTLEPLSVSEQSSDQDLSVILEDNLESDAIHQGQGRWGRQALGEEELGS